LLETEGEVMAIGAGTVLVGLGLALWAFLSGDDAGTDTPGGGGGTGGGGTGGGGGGGTSDKPKGPPAGPGGSNVPSDVPVNPSVIGGGGVWGDQSKIPSDFNWNGNGWWVSNDCDAVAIGRGFAPDEFTLLGSGQRQLISTLQSVTTIVPPPVSQTGTLWNYLYHLGFDMGDLPDEMIRKVKAALNLYCSEVEQWPSNFAQVLEAEIDDFYSSSIGGVE
jgi:hypothetical protein